MRRRHIFFGEQLDDIGQRLQQAMRTHSIRPDSKLDVRDNLSLDPLQIRERGHQHERDQPGLDQGQDKKIHYLYSPPGASSNEPKSLEYRPSVPEVKSV